MPTPRKKKPPARRPTPMPQHHRMTATEYFSYRRSLIAADAHLSRERAEDQERAQFEQVKQDETQRAEMLKHIEPGYHWVTIHWLVPNGPSVRAETISGRVKDVKDGKVEFWVDSVPDETKLHQISNGDILEVPLEAVTSVSAPVAS